MHNVLTCSQLSLQHEELEVEEFQLIEKLQQLGINAGTSDKLSLVVRILALSRCCVSWEALETGAVPGDIKKAKEAGYHTCESLLMNTRKVRMLRLRPRRN